eukprot:4023593-Prymnesium_polylepis.1
MPGPGPGGGEATVHSTRLITADPHPPHKRARSMLGANHVPTNRATRLRVAVQPFVRPFNMRTTQDRREAPTAVRSFSSSDFTFNLKCKTHVFKRLPRSTETRSLTGGSAAADAAAAAVVARVSEAGPPAAGAEGEVPAAADPVAVQEAADGIITTLSEAESARAASNAPRITRESARAERGLAADGWPRYLTRKRARPVGAALAGIGTLGAPVAAQPARPYISTRPIC